MENELIEEFIKLTETTVDYSSTLSVMKNNRNAKRLLKLHEKISSDMKMAEIIYGKLLEHHNYNVKRVAASHCLKLNIHIQKSEQVLESYIKNGEDKGGKVSAKIVLELWKEGKL